MTKQVSHAANPRVVSLNGRGHHRNPGQRILDECRDLLVSKLCAWLRESATPVAEELFVLADSTRERLLQTRYLDLRADIEKEWTQLIETFRRHLSAEAERCQHQEKTQSSTIGTPLEIPDFEGLQLVDDDVLSEHIVIREFSAQLSETCNEELYTLDRRVAALLGRDDPDDSSNPLAPAIVCRALSDACSTIGADAESRLILLRRLERHLHRALPDIYRQINAYLIERSILPDLKRTYRRSELTGSTSAPTSSAGRASPNQQTTLASGNAGVAGNQPLAGDAILDALQRIAHARTVPLSGGQIASTAIQTSNTGISDALIASLNALQHAPFMASGEGITNQIRQIRESENTQQVGGLEAVTIDVVAMLFDFIFDDKNVPLAVKALLSRLQIPVLKVAMLNPGFFADRQHPTRRFLSSISGVAIRWGGTVDESDPFYQQLERLIVKIQAEFEQDVGVFGQALEALETFVKERESEEDTTTQTAASVVIQREHETESTERAQHAVRMFLNNTPQPELIVGFIREYWERVLASAALADDATNSRWDSALETMHDLAWSIAPKKGPDDRLKLVGLLPKLLSQLNKGLDRVDAEVGKRSAFFDALMKSHASALKGEMLAVAAHNSSPAAVEPTSFAPAKEGDLQVTHSTDHGVEVEEVVLVGASPIWRADEREIFRQVSELKRGAWVEFHDEDGKSTRERLNWISPQRGILLFSNHRAAKALSIAPEALVRQIRDGKASILCEEEFFERALSEALESINAA